MSSWKTYGGQSENIGSASFRNITTETLRVRDKFIGNFDISGSLYVSTDASFGGNVTINHSLDVSENITSNNNFVLNLLNVANDAQFENKVYFGKSNRINGVYNGPGDPDNYFYGLNGNGIGLGTTNPIATLDICGNNFASIQVNAPNSIYNRNILARNKNNEGIVLGTDSSHSYIEFYIDTPISKLELTDPPTYDAFMAVYPDGNFVIDVSQHTFLLTSVIIKPLPFRPMLTNPQVDLCTNVFDETASIYDSVHSGIFPLLFFPNDSINNNNNPYVPQTGNALSLISKDTTSSTFLHLCDPQKNGIAYSGGTAPFNGTRAFGMRGWTTSAIDVFTKSNFQLAEVLISSINRVRTPFSISYNNYTPESEVYLMTINGKTHITNGQLTFTNESSFYINEISMAPSPNTLGIAVGNASNLYVDGSGVNYYQYNILNTQDGGQTWNSIDLSTSLSGKTFYTSGNRNDIISVFTYDNSYSFIGTINHFMFYTNDGGNNWKEIQIPTLNSSQNTNITSIYVSQPFTTTSLINRFFIATNYIFAYFDIPSNFSYSLSGDITIIDNLLIDIPHNNFPDPTKLIAGTHSPNTLLYAIAGNSIASFNIQTPTIFNIQYTLSQTDLSYSSIAVYDDNTVIAVGGNYISYKTIDISWTDVSVNNIGNLLNVSFYDNQNALALGTNGFIYSSPSLSNPTPTFSTWIPVPFSLLNTNGIYGFFNLLPGQTVNYNLFTFTNLPEDVSNSIILINNNPPNDPTKLWQGNSHVYYGYYPNLFNKANNTILNVDGNMYLEGDLITDGANINSTASNVNLLNQNVQTINIGGNTSNIFLGNSITGNVQVQNQFNVLGNSNLYGNLDVSNNTNLQSNLLVEGIVTINNLLIASDSSFNGNINVQSNISGNNITASDNIYSNDLTGLLDNNNRRILTINADTLYLGDENTNVVVRGLFVPDVSGNDSSYNSYNRIYVTDIAFIGNLILTSNIIYTNDNSSVNISSLDISNGLIVNGTGTFNKDLSIIGNTNINNRLTVSNDVSFNGILDVSGNTNLKSYLNVTNDASFSGNVSVYGSININNRLNVPNDSSFNARLDVSGNTNLKSYLNVTKDASFNGNISVAGNTTLNNRLTVTNDVSLNSILDVSGNTNLKSNLNVSNNASFNGNLSVTGNTSLNNKLTVTNDVSLNSILDVSGNTNLKSNLNVSNNASFNGNISITGNTTLNNKLTVTNDVSLNSILDVSGNTNLKSYLNVIKDASFNGNISVAGNTSINNRLSVTNDALLNGNLNVIGNASLNNILYVKNKIGINVINPTNEFELYGNGYVRYNFNIQGNLTANVLNANTIYLGNNLTVNNRLIVINDVSLNSRLDVTGNTSLNNKLTVTNDVSLNSILDVTGNTNLKSNLIVSNNASFNGNLSVTGNTNLSNKLYVNNSTNRVGINNSNPQYDLDINGNCNVSGNLTVTGTNFNISILNIIYPVGSIYMNYNNFTTPSTLFSWSASTWSQIPVGTTFVSGVSGNATFGTLGRTGGNAKISQHNHQWNRRGVTSDNLSLQTYNIPPTGTTPNSQTYDSNGNSMQYTAAGSVRMNIDCYTDNVIGADTNATSNYPPYVVVSMWRRTG